MVAGAQTTSNLATAQAQAALNNTNQVTPFGSVNYSQPGGPDTPFTETVQLSPQEQAIFDASTANQAGALGLANGDLANVQAALAKPVQPISPLATGVQPGQVLYGFNPGPNLQFGFGAGGPVQTQVGGPSQQQAIQQAQNAAYQGQTQFLDPQWAQNAEQEQAQLTAQGLNPNSAAYQNAMTQFDNARTQAYSNAALQAVSAGDNEQNTLFGQTLGSGNFANAAQQQQYGENQAQAAFQNAAAGQQATQNQAQAGFQNAAQAQQFGQGQQNAALYNAAAGQQFASQLQAQQAPINEFTALQANSQIQAPQSTPAQTQVAPTDVLGAYQMQQNALQQDYAAQMQGYQAGMGGLFNLGTAALSVAAAPFTGGASLAGMAAVK